ncbi:MAG: histone H1-like repetitive region-containing protein [Treponema sp.]|jgi:flagellar biosynthesis GTPase FlhF|nr:histone H1-like repetitive region-containing protein [Treponema sp.]
MATITKKSAAAKPASTKKPAAKKTVAKKPAAKKPAAKKPAAKKTAVKKPAAKKPAAKKPAVKKPAVKKPAAKKPAAKKPAAKKPAAKKPAAKKPAAKKTAAKKPAAKHVSKDEAFDFGGAKAMDLFEAYVQEKLPKDQGYIISSFFSENSAYSIYEIVSYSGVKAIHLTETGLLFQTNGKKLHVLVEPATYPLKATEPVSRNDRERIPKRFNELETIIAKNQTRIMIAKEPIESFASFTVLKPTGINFALVFYNLPDINENLATFFEKSLNMELKIPQSDARAASRVIAGTVEKTMSFKGEFA